MRRLLLPLGATVATVGTGLAAMTSTAADAPSCGGRPATLVASGARVIVGTPAADVIVARGVLVVRGGAGDDVICASASRLRGAIVGGEGNDGGPGGDRCVGAPGRDSFRSCEHRPG